MNTSKRNRLIPAVLMVLAAFLVTSCEMKEKDYVEYRAEDIAYYRGDSCFERYRLYEEDGTYERYIGGTYCGKELPGLVFGTLYETGTYKKNPNVSGGIIFTSKKQYDFDEKELVNQGNESETRYGKISGETLTIKYRIWVVDGDDWFYSGYFDTVEHEYTRK